MRAFLASIARERSFEPATGEDCINALEILECNRAFFDIALEAEEGIKIQHGRA